MKTVYLQVEVTNTPALKMYEKLGFAIARIIPAYYVSGKDAYEMHLNL